MGDPKTLETRLAQARAVTNAQKPSAAPSAPAEAAPSKPAPAAKPADTIESGDDGGDPESGESALTRLIESDDDKSADADKSSDEGEEKPKTQDELTKSFIRLGKREDKLKKKQKEWREDVAKKDAEHAKKEAEFKTARQELINEHNRITALQRQASERFGWVAKGQQAWDNDDKIEFARAIEKMGKGAPLSRITQWLAGVGDKPSAPAKPQPSQEEQDWRREKAEWERQRAEQAGKGDESKKEQDTEKSRAEAKARVAVAFAQHPFLKNPDDPKKPDPDALDEAFDKIRAALKQKKPGELPRQVAKRVLDELHAREVRRLKRLGLEPKVESKTKDKNDKSGSSKDKPGQRLPEPPPSNGSGKKPSLSDTRAARIAQAKRMTEQQRRGVA